MSMMISKIKGEDIHQVPPCLIDSCHSKDDSEHTQETELLSDALLSDDEGGGFPVFGVVDSQIQQNSAQSQCQCPAREEDYRKMSGTVYALSRALLESERQLRIKSLEAEELRFKLQMVSSFRDGLAELDEVETSNNNSSSNSESLVTITCDQPTETGGEKQIKGKRKKRPTVNSELDKAQKGGQTEEHWEEDRSVSSCDSAQRSNSKKKNKKKGLNGEYGDDDDSSVSSCDSAHSGNFKKSKKKKYKKKSDKKKKEKTRQDTYHPKRVCYNCPTGLSVTTQGTTTEEDEEVNNDHDKNKNSRNNMSDAVSQCQRATLLQAILERDRAQIQNYELVRQVQYLSRVNDRLRTEILYRRCAEPSLFRTSSSCDGEEQQQLVQTSQQTATATATSKTGRRRFFGLGDKKSKNSNINNKSKNKGKLRPNINRALSAWWIRDGGQTQSRIGDGIRAVDDNNYDDDSTYSSMRANLSFSSPAYDMKDLGDGDSDSDSVPIEPFDSCRSGDDEEREKAKLLASSLEADELPAYISAADIITTRTVPSSCWSETWNKDVFEDLQRKRSYPMVTPI